MVDPTDGYIGIKTKGKNQEEIKKIEKRVAAELDAFKTEKFMYFLFINVLWIIISCIVLMYTGLLKMRRKVELSYFSEKLLSIPIVIPDNIANCGEKIEDEDSEDDTFMNLVYMLGPKSNISREYTEYPEYPDDYSEGGNGSNSGEKVIYLQPFSLFFLSFYIILIITQFICMLWHR